MLASGPIEFSSIDNDASNSSSVSPDPFSGGGGNDVGAVLEGLAEVGRGKGGVDDEGKSNGVGLVGDGFNVKDVEGGVGASLGEEGPGFVVSNLGEILGVGSVDESDLNSQVGQEFVELGVGAAVELAGGDDVVAGLGEGDDGVEDGWKNK